MEKPMIHKRLFSTLAVLCLTLTANLHASECSLASLKGAYAFSSQGFVEVTPDVSAAGFVPWAEIGIEVFDGKGGIPFGTFSASTANAAGGINNGPFKGTYSVDKNCTGSATVEQPDGSSFHFDLVIEGPETITGVSNQPNEFISVFTAHKITQEASDVGSRPATADHSVSQD
jgi:hypothetical protein